MALYELSILGAPSPAQVAELESHLTTFVTPFGLRLGHEVAWSVCPAHFDPPNKTAAAVVFIGADGVSDAGLDRILRSGIPVLPIVSIEGRVHQELPPQLRPFNCLFYGTHGPQRIASSLLECVGLLPRQRRVFVSYRRTEAGAAALQLFDAFSSRLFDVFLDTHGIAPAEDFQSVLWHRLCDSDVLVMIDTPGYFASRWTSAEFGRALAKGISVLRIGWPGFAPSPRVSTASRIDLAPAEVDVLTGQLGHDAIARICDHLETVRSQSHAVRSLNLFSNVKQAVESIGGTVMGVGLHKAIFIKLADGADVVVYPTVGVPTSLSLHDAVDHAPDRSIAVVFDHVGLHPTWLRHLDWLGENIQSARWVKVGEAAWRFADWVV